ncbi:MAG: GDSL-type esterase/lipase family protein [Deltaproteobacteria bacterium]|nr:GDSL-type esterase/lipase family protein [Deltaproteobacteria bacterium]
MSVRCGFADIWALPPLAVLAAFAACSGDEEMDTADAGGAAGENQGGGGGGSAAAGAAGGDSGSVGSGGASGGMGGDGAMAGTGGAPRPVMFGADDPRVLYLGRWDRTDSARPNTDWAGAGVRIRMRGTGVRARFGVWTGKPMYQVVVDGVPKSVLKVPAVDEWTNVVSDLPPGPHVLELFLRTEPVLGRHEIAGFEVTGELEQALPAKHRIEFIGDSITCGYGNEAKSVNEPFSAEGENNFLAYGSLTARALEADAATIAISGRRLTGIDGMPDAWEGTVGGARKPAWDFSRWKPEVVVINLGTNDFDAPAAEQPSSADFVARYDAFVTRIRQVYGDVFIFCTTGPMLAEAATQAFVNKRNAANDKRVFFVDFGTQLPGDGLGGDYHPSLKTHAKMATKLTDAIKAQTGW